MTNLELENLGFAPAGPVAEHEVTGGFCCDLLSWAMSRCTEGKVWFTVMGNINTVAVASLADAAAVVLCQEAAWMPDALERAAQQGVALFTTDLPAYEAALVLARKLGQL
ncbi:hypothetical protein [Gemmiger sp. An50]|uniref:hypothetical protein n=1 Tax=Gemmiger sp. An50 TaxID=1965639 RepID=UPI000B37B394|nr:hypothetical protein [Gemmiger sp. An50]OUN87387.1 hypothetical protein B5G03_04450 [Gemmiger sp. An50]